MPAATKAKPLIPLKTKDVEAKFPVIPTVDDKNIYVGAIQGSGVFIATELMAVLYKSLDIEDDLNGIISVGSRKKLSYKNGEFYLGKEKASIETTDKSYTVRMLIEGYMQSEGDALSGNVLEELLNRRHVVFRPYLSFIDKYENAKFSIMKTLAENYNNSVLKIENDEWVVLIAVDTIPEGYIFDFAFYDALSIVGSKPFRIGFDSYGRLAFFSIDTAVIVPDVVNKGLVGLCTQVALGKDEANCGIVISKELDKVMVLCSEYYLNITDKISNLLDKKLTSTPVVNEIATGKCKWQKASDQKLIDLNGIELMLVAECKELEGYKKDNIKVIIEKK